MFGILRNGKKLLSNRTNREKYRIDQYGNIVIPDRSVWVEFEYCADPYIEESRWECNSRILKLQKIYSDDDLEMIEFSPESLELFVVNRLKGY